ncbi:MAG TPA: hypothetical protein DHW82_03245 [Spirochaetia bacterium]|nr:hypothetical protein [Spirochaetia bacterium]
MEAKKNSTALWIELSIPYDENARFMSGRLGYQDAENGNISVLTVRDCKNIPETIDKLLNTAKENAVETSSPITLIFPLDERHNLAWYVKEEADKRKWEFSRHIPENQEVSDFMTHKTAQADEVRKLSNEDARTQIMKLNEDARQEYQSSDLLRAITCLRHALELSLEYFDFNSPETAYTVRNLVYTYQATGSYENEKEALKLIQKISDSLKIKGFKNRHWTLETASLLEELAMQSIKLMNAELLEPLTLFANQIRESLN